MNPFKFVLYDIKRLFGHGKTAFIAMLSPIPVLLLFGLFFAPLLLDRGETFYSIATLNDDNSKIGYLMNLTLKGGKIECDELGLRVTQAEVKVM